MPRDPIIEEIRINFVYTWTEYGTLLNFKIFFINL